MSVRPSITVDTKSFETWIEKRLSLEDQTLTDFKHKGADLTLEEMVKQAPRGKTGRLKQSIVHEITEKGFSVFPVVSYAKFVEHGTRPHLIIPRFAKVLRWLHQEVPVFSMYVMHPGFKGRKFVEKTQKIVVPKLFALATTLWGRLHD